MIDVPKSRISTATPQPDSDQVLKTNWQGIVMVLMRAAAIIVAPILVFHSTLLSSGAFVALEP